MHERERQGECRLFHASGMLGGNMRQPRLVGCLCLSGSAYVWPKLIDLFSPLFCFLLTNCMLTFAAELQFPNAHAEASPSALRSL